MMKKWMFTCLLSQALAVSVGIAAYGAQWHMDHMDGGTTMGTEPGPQASGNGWMEMETELRSVIILITMAIAW